MIRPVLAPRAWAPATNSRSRSDSTSPRTRMANVGTNVTARAPITFQRLTPRNAVMAKASTREGKTRSASMARMRRSDSRPLKVPAIRPTAVPAPKPASTERIPTTTEMRVPPMIWLKTSRPRGSVPRRWVRLGPWRTSRGLYRRGS